MTKNDDKQPHEMSGLGTFIMGLAVCGFFWFGSHLDAEPLILWLVGSMACVFVIGIVAILEDKFNWDFYDEDEDEE